MYTRQKKYVVRDAYGRFLRSFAAYQQAATFKIANGRHDWPIVYE